MHHEEAHLSQFHREYLRELEIAHKQLIALAEAVPEEAYNWRPAADARTFSAVLVHVAAGNLMLLYRADVYSPAVMELCGAVEGEGLQQWVGMVRQGFHLERTVTAKPDVMDLLKRSFDEVREAFAAASDEEICQLRDMAGEPSTFRRLYLRILAHANEHMGQAVAYARAMGFHAPWPDPVNLLERMAAEAASAAGR
jgi:uncharacterized damage-inducible protein DinB